MSSSAINAQLFQAKIGSIQNQADSTSVYSNGIWSFKNSTALTSVTITDSGNVGIGTASPTSKLHVNAGGNYGILTMQAVNGSDIAFTSGATTISSIAVDSTAGANPTMIFRNGGTNTERMRIDASGNLGLGVTSQITGNVNGIFLGLTSGTRRFGAGTTGSFNQIEFWTSAYAGAINTTGTTTTYTSASDYRLKEDVQPISAALAKVSALKPCTYRWKVDGSEGQGFIAHELAEVCPVAVIGEKDEINEDGSIKPQSIDQSKLVALLTAAIQELSTKNEALEARLAALESKP